MKALNIHGEERLEYLRRNVLVKEDKKHRCYHYIDMFEDL